MVATTLVACVAMLVALSTVARVRLSVLLTPAKANGWLPASAKRIG
jgi:hypothetical protein